jgi:hypothetical protein
VPATVSSSSPGQPAAAAVAPDLPLHVIVNWTAGLPRQ